MDPTPAWSASKAEWRRWTRQLPPVDAGAARAVTERVQAFFEGVDGPVLGYLALPDEVPIDDLIRPGLCLPRLGEQGKLTVHVDAGARERHALGIEQPPAGVAVVEPAMLAAVLVPGRVFDREGYRLGRGGGHYDRLLPHLAPGTPVVGVTIEARVVDRLPREPHDVPMTHLVTEDGVRSLTAGDAHR